jgi:hypothetical protein
MCLQFNTTRLVYLKCYPDDELGRERQWLLNLSQEKHEKSGGRVNMNYTYNCNGNFNPLCLRLKRGICKIHISSACLKYISCSSLHLLQ